MEINDLPQQYKDEAYRLLRSIYKFIPYYNQIKGTYLGIQFILNTMGLCSSIIELWAAPNNITNFSENVEYYREDEIHAVRRFTEDVAMHAGVKDYYLTSTFDVDLTSQAGITFKEFNGMSKTIITVINEVRPVTRCLRKLYYLLLVNSNIHFDYYFENQKSPNLEYNKETDPDAPNPYNLDFRRFDYLWYCYRDEPFNKCEYDFRLKQLSKIYLPYDALGARFTPNGDDYTTDSTYTMINTYFNLNKLNVKLRKSQVEKFRFKIFIRRRDRIFDIRSTPVIEGNLGTDISISLDKNGIYINLLNAGLQTALNLDELFSDLRPLPTPAGKKGQLGNYDLFIATNFIIVLGTNYLFQDTGIYDWSQNAEINFLLDEFCGLIPERSSYGDGVHLASQHNDILVGEDMSEEDDTNYPDGLLTYSEDDNDDSAYITTEDGEYIYR